MRILHVTKRFHPFSGGVERYVEDLARGQVERGHHVAILTIDRDMVGGATERQPAYERDGRLEIHRVPAAGGKRKQFATGGFDQIVRSLRVADVVHHHDPRFLFETAVAVRRMLGRPIIFHTHGLIWHTPNYLMLKRAAMRYYYGPILRHAVDAIIADSESDVALLRHTAGVSGTLVHLIPNAIKLDTWFAIDSRPESGMILVFGRIDRHKGLSRLFHTLRDVSSGWRLVVVGTGEPELLAQLTAEVHDLGIAERVTWTGWASAEELRDLLARATLVVFPSSFEGFGLALLETLAAGRPVLASDLPSHREVLGPGLFSRIVAFDAGAEASAGAISGALVASPDEQAALGRAERARAAEFAFPQFLDRVEATYRVLGLAAAQSRS